ncbi:MAG: SMC-Scp complex subunit ScpB [Gammaproteobacteria bacterium]|nr:SMC-Scp complex subunit ScpB [Gammaproteobacteria bacterium]
MADLTLTEVKRIVETLLFAADEPLNVAALMNVFEQEYDDPRTFRELLLAALNELEMDCEARGIELVQVASGFRLQVDETHSEWVHRLWRRNPPRYSRALLETLAMIAYQQPITRGEIDEVRGVTTSGNILRRLQERGWVRELGRKQVPGLPILYGTTRAFLDYFNLRSIGDLPPLADGESLRVKEESLSPPRVVSTGS